MPNLKETFNLFDRDITTQFFILGFWLIGLICIAFTMVYESLIPTLIYRGVLPKNQISILLVGIGLLILSGFILILNPKKADYLTPTDSAN